MKYESEIPASVESLLSPLMCSSCVENEAVVWRIEIDEEQADRVLEGTLLPADRFRCFSVDPLCERCAAEIEEEERHGSTAGYWDVQRTPVRLDLGRIVVASEADRL